MAEEGGRPGRRLLKIVIGFLLAVLLIGVVYALASLSDASLSAPAEAVIIACVLVVSALVVWLFTHRAATGDRVEQNGAASVLEGVRTASWPPGRVTSAPAPAAPRPSPPPLPMPTLVRPDPTVPVPATARSAASVGSPGTELEFAL